MIFAMLVLLSVLIIIYAGIVLGKSESSQTTAEKVFLIIVLSVMVVGCFILGLAGAGELMPAILAPFVLLFLVCVYTAKEDRATARLLLKQVNEKLENTEKELAEIKLLLKKENTDEQNIEEDTESDNENQE